MSTNEQYATKKNVKTKGGVMSQAEKIMYHLSSGHRITPLQALSEFGCFRLASVVYRLKREYDLDIVTHIKEDFTGEEVKRYAEYSLRVGGINL